MYPAHFGLSVAPFSVAPDPHYFYLSERHRRALANLSESISDNAAFMTLIGEVGTGKTTLCHVLKQQLPENVNVALLPNSRITFLEFLTVVCDELRISYQKTDTLKELSAIVTSYLVTAQTVGLRTVLILDEAQHLSVDVLEQIRALTELKTTGRKPLQIILVGQSELKKLLKHPRLQALTQHITARHSLLPLSAKETYAYINHRLAISGARSPLFTKAAMRLIHWRSGGVPRLINIICRRALLEGYVNNQNPIDPRIVRKAIQEGQIITLKRLPIGWFINIGIASLIVGVLSWWWINLPETSVSTQTEATPSKILTLPTATTATPTASLSKPETTRPPAPPDLLNLLQTPTILSDEKTALTRLFQLWNLEHKELVNTSACNKAATQGLICLDKTGTWEDVRRLNRPAMLELVIDNGKQYHVVLARLRDKVATLDFAGQRYEFPTQKISEYWLGQFLLLWRPPSLPVPKLKVGMASNDVVWIRKRLDTLEKVGSNANSLSTRFDETLKRRVVTFQRTKGVTADGAVGEDTLLLLDAAAGEKPLLSD